MKLLTAQIKKALPKFYTTDHIPLEDKIVICKFFTPDANWTWFVFEGEFCRQRQNYIFFGYIDGLEAEMDYFALSELSSFRGPLGLPIERDTSVLQVPFKQLMRDLMPRSI